MRDGAAERPLRRALRRRRGSSRLSSVRRPATVDRGSWSTLDASRWSASVDPTAAASWSMSVTVRTSVRLGQWRLDRVADHRGDRCAGGSALRSGRCRRSMSAVLTVHLVQDQCISHGPALRHRPQGAAPRPPRRRSATGDVVELAAEVGHDAARPDAESLGQWFTTTANSGSLVTLPRDLRPHGRGDADRRRADAGGRASASRTWPRTASCTPRSATPPSSTLDAGLTLDEVVAAVQQGFEEGMARPRRGPSDRGPPAAHRDAARGQLPGDRRALGRLPRQRRRGFDIAGAEAGYPAHPPPRRVRVPPARELPLHDPRRRGIRAAVDLGGHPVVRRRSARPRRADRRRHRP